MIQEKDILRCENGLVTYRWRDSKTNKSEQRTVSGVEFLRLVLQHVLPKGFRRARNYGFLHPNSKKLIVLLRLLVFKLCDKTPAKSATATPTERPKWLCRCCGGVMHIVRRRICRLRLRHRVSTPTARCCSPVNAQIKTSHIGAAQALWMDSAKNSRTRLCW